MLWANRKGCLTRPRCRVLVFWGQCKGAWELSRAEWSPAPSTVQGRLWLRLRGICWAELT